MSRDEIELRNRCSWFDSNCYICNGLLKAYEGVNTDYILLCQTYLCKNWSRGAFVNDMCGEIIEKDFKDICYR